MKAVVDKLCLGLRGQATGTRAIPKTQGSGLKGTHERALEREKNIPVTLAEGRIRKLPVLLRKGTGFLVHRAVATANPRGRLPARAQYHGEERARIIAFT